MNRAGRRRQEKQKGEKDIAQIIQQDRQQLIMLGLISSLEILKRDFGFTQEQIEDFANKYKPEMEKQMNVHKK